MEPAGSSDIAEVSQVALLVLDHNVGVSEFGADWWAASLHFCNILQFAEFLPGCQIVRKCPPKEGNIPIHCD